MASLLGGEGKISTPRLSSFDAGPGFAEPSGWRDKPVAKQGRGLSASVGHLPCPLKRPRPYAVFILLGTLFRIFAPQNFIVCHILWVYIYLWKSYGMNRSGWRTWRRTVSTSPMHAIGSPLKTQ